MTNPLANQTPFTYLAGQNLAEKLAAAHDYNNAANADKAREFREIMQNSIASRGGSKTFAALMGNLCERLDAKEMARVLENMDNQNKKSGIDEEETADIIEEYEKQQAKNADYTEKREVLIKNRQEALEKAAQTISDKTGADGDKALIQFLERLKPDMRYTIDESPEEDEDKPGSVDMYLSGRMEEDEKKHLRDLVDIFTEEEQNKEDSADSETNADVLRPEQTFSREASPLLGGATRSESSAADGS